MTVDILAQLAGPSWRGIPFPVSHWRNRGTHSHAPHAFVDVDGIHIEATGFDNFLFDVEIPFHNNILPGPQELWAGRVLYPDVFRAFLTACVDKTSDDLVHPELGRLTCKVREFDWDYVASGPRDGVNFHVSWTTSLDNEETLNGILGEQSPVATAVTLADKLDSDLGELTPPPPELANDTESFGDMMRAIQAIPDTAALLSKQAGGLIHRVASKIDRVSEALDRLNDVRLWPIRDGIEHLRSSLIDLSHLNGVDNKVIREYVVRARTTLPALATILNNKIDDLIRLNPLVLEEPSISVGERIRYYVQR